VARLDYPHKTSALRQLREAVLLARVIPQSFHKIMTLFGGEFSWCAGRGCGVARDKMRDRPFATWAVEVLLLRVGRGVKSIRSEIAPRADSPRLFRLGQSNDLFLRWRVGCRLLNVPQEVGQNMELLGQLINVLADRNHQL